MAKLYFYYSAMNAGKSTLLLQSSFNYQERGMRPLIMTAAIDDRAGIGKVASRIGLSAEALIFQETDDLFTIVQQAHHQERCHCILVDEAQFMTRDQIWQLSDVVDHLNIPVLCYGIRTDFQGNLFEGSKWLLAWADVLQELKTVCHCGRKANMILRLDQNGNPIREGDQIAIGGNDLYSSVCRKHYKEAFQK